MSRVAIASHQRRFQKKMPLLTQIAPQFINRMSPKPTNGSVGLELVPAENTRIRKTAAEARQRSPPKIIKMPLGNIRQRTCLKGLVLRWTEEGGGTGLLMNEIPSWDSKHGNVFKLPDIPPDWKLPGI